MALFDTDLEHIVLTAEFHDTVPGSVEHALLLFRHCDRATLRLSLRSRGLSSCGTSRDLKQRLLNALLSRYAEDGIELYLSRDYDGDPDMDVSRELF
jgi:hypothetical protein